MDVLTPVKKVCNAWSAISLSNIQADLDNIVGGISSRSSENDASRKKLVDLSRECKKNATEDSKKLFAPLLIGFQSEIDVLSARCKRYETFLLYLYGKLLNIPDPVVALERAVALNKKYLDIVTEDEELRKSVANYQSEMSGLHNQEITVKRLREKIKQLENNVACSTNDVFKEKMDEKILAYEKNERRMQAEKDAAEENSRLLQLKMDSLSQTLEQNKMELTNLKSHFDLTILAKSEEIDILILDAERANEKVATYSKLVSRLQSERDEESLLSLGSEEKETIFVSNVENVKSLEHELSIKEKQILRLYGEVNNLESSLKNAKKEHDEVVRELEHRASAAVEELKSVTKSVFARHDYDSIKNELAILRTVHFAEETEMEDNVMNGSLERLLVKKNHKLENALLQSKTKEKAVSMELHGVRERLNVLQEDYNRKAHMATELDKEVSSLRLVSVEGDFLANSDLLLSSIDTGDSESSNKHIFSSNTGNSSASSESIVRVLISQRDRQGRLLGEMEQDLSKKKHELLMQQEEVSNLKSDNRLLYEKIRYLQSYSKSSNHTIPDISLTRLQGDYESNLDPFRVFAKKERHRKYLSLTYTDKMAYSIGRFLMSNRAIRTLSLIYLFLVHMLVFFVLFHTSATQSYGDDECNRKFAEHMLHVHADHR